MNTDNSLNIADADSNFNILRKRSESQVEIYISQV